MYIKIYKEILNLYIEPWKQNLAQHTHQESRTITFRRDKARNKSRRQLGL